MTWKERYGALSSETRNKVSIAVVLSILAIAATLLWSSRSAKKEVEAKEAKIATAKIDEGLLEDTVTDKVDREIAVLQTANAELTAKINSLVDLMNRHNVDADKTLERIEKDAKTRLAEIEAAREAGAPGTVTGGGRRARGESLDLKPRNELAGLGAYEVADSYPEPPKLVTPVAPQGLVPADYTPPEPKVLGAIAAMPTSGFDAPEKKSASDAEGIFLPPGFMNAR
ncbi:MAG: hypothetical protein AAFY22_12695, partial [Pseudomonadota bacterium]